MKKTIINFVGVLSFIAVAVQGDLIVNPGFEDGLTGWTTFGQGWRTGGGGDANSGSVGLVNDVLPSDTDGFRGIFQNIAVTEGVVYTFSTYIRTVNLESSKSWLEVQWLDSGAGVISQAQSSLVISDQGFTLTTISDVTAPSGAVQASVRGIVQMDTLPADGDFHIFDDFAVVPEPSTTLLALCGGLVALAARRRKLFPV